MTVFGCACQCLVAHASVWLRMPVFGCACQCLVAHASVWLGMSVLGCSVVVVWLVAELNAVGPL